jgi:hypothetical protein
LADRGARTGESDLDLQLITAMARNATTVFHLNNNAGRGFYDWAIEVSVAEDPAMVRPLHPPLMPSACVAVTLFGADPCVSVGLQVYSVSWGSGEISYRGSSYTLNAPNEVQFAKLAARGISVLVSSGACPQRSLAAPSPPRT